jgi:hypothetical protein
MKAETGNLQGDWHALEACWRETREGWNDSVAWRFEREFWEPLSQTANKMLQKTEALSERLERVRAMVKS